MPWKALINPQVVDILIGQEIVQYGTDTFDHTLPYLKIYDIPTISKDLFLPSSTDWDSLPNSRRERLRHLLSEAYKYNKVDKVLEYLFNKRRYVAIVSNFSSVLRFDEYYIKTVRSIIDSINQIIHLYDLQLIYVNNQFLLQNISESQLLKSFDSTIDSHYIKNLSQRIQNDLDAHNYDSVITKCRTLLEELCMFIIEENNGVPSNDGKLQHLWKQTKIVLNMNDVTNFDKRVTELISGLNKIIDSISSLRNINSDAHGAGSRRVNIGTREANLIVNSTIAVSEYIYDVFHSKALSHKNVKTGDADFGQI